MQLALRVACIPRMVEVGYPKTFAVWEGRETFCGRRASDQLGSLSVPRLGAAG